MQAAMKPAAMTTDREFAADCKRRSEQLYAKARKEENLFDRDRLMRVAASYAEDAAFWSRHAESDF